MNRMVYAMIAAALLVLDAASAATITVFEDDFESPKVSEYGGFVPDPGLGFYTRNQINGWTRNAVNGDTYGVYAPNLSLFTAEGQEHFDGSNDQVAYTAGRASIFAPIGLVAKITSYTVSFDIGNRFGQSGVGAASLFVEDPNGSHSVVVPNRPPLRISQFLSDPFTSEIGKFSTKSFSVTADQLGADLVGNNLYVGILGLSGASVLFDNVVVTASSEVPLPAAGLIFVAGIVSFSVNRRLSFRSMRS